MAWDAMALFQGLLDDLPQLLARARDLRTKDAGNPLAIKAAVIGFSLFHPIRAWSRDNYLYVEQFISGEPSFDDFAPSEEHAEAYTVFGCLGIGALLGQFNAGEVDDEEASKGEWHLVAFLSLHGAEVYTVYKSVINGSASSAV